MTIRQSLPIITILCGLLNATDSARAQDWSFTAMPNAIWKGVACSTDGMKVVVDGYASGIWVSTNRGATWSAEDTSETRWSAVASSADGTKLVAVSQDAAGSIYTSTNSGASWHLTTAVMDDYHSVASSADGSKLVAVSAYTIYVSTNSGVDWVENPYMPFNGIWNSVTISADGTKMAAAAGVLWILGGTIDTLYGGGELDFSTNSGVSWVTSDAPGNWDWSAIACSSNGNFMVAGAYGDTNHNPGPIYISTNSGAHWAPTIAPNLAYGCVNCSADGSKVTVACKTPTSYPNGVYSSTNSGSTWTQDTSLFAAGALACSADGTKRVATTAGGWLTVNNIAVSPPQAVRGGPQLIIMPSGKTVAIYWPASAAGYVLQSTANLSAGSWASITNGISTAGSYSVFTTAAGGNAAFFRLKQ